MFNIRTEKLLDKNSWISLSIESGKYHQIKDMFERLRIFVSEIKRIKIGNLTLFELNPGEYKYVSKKELKLKIPIPN